MGVYKLQIKNGESNGQYIVILFRRSRFIFGHNWRRELVFEGSEFEINDYILLLCKIRETIIMIENKSDIDNLGNRSIKTLYDSL